MKKLFYSILFLTLGFSTLMAQGITKETEKNVKITVITKDGKKIIEKIRYNGEMPNTFEHFDNLDPNLIETINVEIIREEELSKEDLFLRGIKPNHNFDLKKGRRFHSPARPMLGIYIDENHNSNGVKLDNVIQGKGAAAAGLQRGDVVVKVDQTTINKADELAEILENYKIGDEVTIQFERNGTLQDATITLTPNRPKRKFERFSHRERLHIETDPCKVFIGITSVTNSEGGRTVQRIIEGTAASEMDLQEGDVIVEMDGRSISSIADLINERDANEPGDYFRLTILRDGERKKVRGQFQECPTEEVEITETPTPQLNQEQGFEYERFDAFPNPTYDEVNISFTGKAVPTTIRLTDITGKVVYEESLEHFDGSYQKQVQLRSRATPGAVSLSVIQEGQVVTKNIILLNRA